MKSITFTGDSIRAMLRIDSPKTQTRRVVKTRKVKITGDRIRHAPSLEHTVLRSQGSPQIWTDGNVYFSCPYGQPGDRLWVKENYAYPIEYDHLKPSQVSGQVPVFYQANTEKDWKIQSNGKVVGKWRSSRFMPRLASRIILEVVNVRVERVQDITEKDIIAEGITSTYPHDQFEKPLPNPERTIPMLRLSNMRTIWDSINAKRGHSWDKNEWVWAMAFRIDNR